MTDKSASLVELAERCEAAAGPDRELDQLVAKAVGYRDVHGDSLLWDRGNDGYWTLDEDSVHPMLPCFSASLDAAMSLVPEGWHIMFLCQDRYTQRTMLALARNGDISGLCSGCDGAATPALALCAAALRALANKESNNASQ